MSYHKSNTLNPDYASSYGTWRVTTEGDCEGKTTTQLGAFTGHIDEIALALADRCYYSLCFRRDMPKSMSMVPTRKSVSVQLDINSGTWDMNSDERAKAIGEILKDRDVTVSPGQYFASVIITTTKETEGERQEKLRNAALAKLSAEEKAALGLK